MVIWFRLSLAIIFSVGVLAGFSKTCEADQESMILKKEAFAGEAPVRLRLGVGESQVVKSPDIKIKDVSLVDPKVADVVVVSPYKINLTGRAPGMTQVVLRGVKPVDCVVFDLEVFAGLSFLKEKLHELLPQENINVNAANDSLFLSGEVSSAANMSLAVSLAEQYVPKKEKLVNLLQIGGVQQVMLEVRVAEMSRNVGKRLGINLAYLRGNDFALSHLGDLTSGGGLSDLLTSSRVNTLFRFGYGGAWWTVFIDLLKENELVKILAEPTLVATSGQEARFLAGGEIPIPIPEDLGRVEIEYKPYGVGLTFTPTVLSGERISLRVAPEVSEPDYTRLVYFAGYAVPAFTTRRASTTIELADGQSFAIAGLFSDQVRQTASKYPVLGDIPVLGALFKSSEFQKNESELVIIVTPHLVKPLDMAKQTLPTDQYIEPDDFEFYLLGAMEGREKPARIPEVSPPQEGMEGEFGHIAPGLR
jgi:pilus assembly protein CpaC